MPTRTESRAEHLSWCKQRAFEYCDKNAPDEAMASFMSDMSKHEETKEHIALGLMFQLRLAGNLRSSQEMRKFIEGFN